MSKVEIYVKKALEIANDDTHGYSQSNRWGKPDYDCSSLVISCVQSAGISVKDKGATYTGNMLSAFKSCGFIDVTSSVNLSTGYGLKRGDILLSRTKHTEIYIGDGKAVGAHISETGKITGKKGDQTGHEISITDYHNHPWTNILRYPEQEKRVNEVLSGGTKSNRLGIDSVAIAVINGEYGNGAARKAKLRREGYNYKEVQKRVNEILK